MEVIYPDWPMISGVKAVSSTRCGGVSSAPYNTLNLAYHVGDAGDSVSLNRSLLAAQLGLNNQSVQWLNQMHGVVVWSSCVTCDTPPDADAAVTEQSGLACAVMTADCLPVLLASKDGKTIAAAHAGWRGLCSGILESTLEKFDLSAGVQAWLGPAIGPRAFEVGDEVKVAFTAQYPACGHYFQSPNHGKWYADLYGLARHILAKIGVVDVYGGQYCTYTDAARFFSYRRDGITGRMATLIWKV